jgi:DNA-binding GntR family transcriptional regulator
MHIVLLQHMARRQTCGWACRAEHLGGHGTIAETTRGGPVARSPKYQQVADDLRGKIANGTYPVGDALPSTSALMSSYGVSVTVARAAIKQLQTEGLAEGQPGKAVYVAGEPAPVEPSAEFTEISRQIGELREALDSAMSRLDARIAALEEKSAR